jgi:hypothetical protein
MQKHIKRKNIRMIVEFQRKSGENPEEELQRGYRTALEQQFAIFRFARERWFLIHTVSALLLLEALLISDRLRVYS